MAVVIGFCAGFAIQTLGFRGSRPDNATPSPFLASFSPQDFLKKCFPKANFGSSRVDRGLRKLAAWHELKDQISARGSGLEDATVVASTVHSTLKAAIDAAVGPTKMASGGGGHYGLGSLEDFWDANGYVFESPNRCVGHISVHCIRAPSPENDWLFVFDVVEVPQ